MVGGPQRRIFEGRLRAVVFSTDYGPGLRLSSRQRRSTAAPFDLAAALDAKDDLAAATASGLRARDDRDRQAEQSKGVRLHAELARRNGVVRVQPGALLTAGDARSEKIRRPGSRRSAIPDRLP